MAPQRQAGRTVAAALWRLFGGVLVLTVSAAVYAWWRGGMWSQGELPTHGMLLAVAGAGAGLAFMALRRAMARRGDRVERR